MPPTFVLTHKSPHDAASRIAIQNASVNDVFKKTCPLVNTSHTLA